MKLFQRAAAFLWAPAGKKRLALEAAWELLRARILTMYPAKDYVAALGEPVEAEQPQHAVVEQDQAVEIGHVVWVVARCLPFRALCLQRAIAVRRMLNRRGIPALVYLGVARDAADRARADEGRAAHAWVAVGSRVISGDGVLEQYAIVARFA